MQRHDNTSYLLGCYQTIASHIQHIFIEGALPLYFSYVNPEQIKHISEDTRSSRRQKPMNKKGNKSEWKQAAKTSSEGTFEYGVLMP